MSSPNPEDEYQTWLANNLVELQRDYAEENKDDFAEFCKEISENVQ